MKKVKKYSTDEPKPSLIQEPMALYAPSVKIIPAAPVKDFTYKSFQKVANKAPFSLKEWADLLHLSERTLQRYAKNNSEFSGIYVDRILHLEQLIDLGLQVFKTPAALYTWLVQDKFVFNKTLNFNALQSQQGIAETYNQLGRILHNVYS